MLRTALNAVAPLAPGAALAQSEPVGDRVEVNGMDMYYEVFAQGDLLIVLHGAYTNIPSPGAIIPKLAETHRRHGHPAPGRHGPPSYPRHRIRP